MSRSGLLILFLSALLAVLSLAYPAGAAPTFPALAGRVTDAAGILPAGTVADLDRRLAALEATTNIQVVVATVPDLQGYEIDEYGYQLGRAWGIGQKGDDNGALLIVAPTERRVRIEVGYGLEGVLTDALTSRIIRQAIVPRFKAGDMAGGVVAGADALIALLELPPAERAAAAQAAAAADGRGRGDSGAPSLPTWIWVVIIIVWLLFSMTRKRRGRGLGSAIVWGPGLGGWGGGGGFGGGGGGGGFGGGGFGGGGGSFGGGGSSGGW